MCIIASTIHIKKKLCSLYSIIVQPYFHIFKFKKSKNFSSIGELLTVLKAKRPLKPERKQRDLVRGVVPSDQNVRLMIHITRGFHIPVRQDLSQADEDDASTPTGRNFLRKVTSKDFSK